jgi:hypothetical protein
VVSEALFDVLGFGSSRFAQLLVQQFYAWRWKSPIAVAYIKKKSTGLLHAAENKYTPATPTSHALF